jgi:formyl-CoA transferase
VVIAGNGDGIFKRLMKAIGRQDLADDPALAHNDGRVQHVEMIDRVIGEWTAGLSLETVLAILLAADVPCGRVYTAADIVKDPQFAARHMIERHRLNDGLDLALPAVVPKLSDTPGQTRWVGPELGAHTQEVLGQLGLSSHELEQLRQQGVI